MTKIKLFNKGDVILTNPETGFYGIAVVLSETEKTPERYPMCHIAITQLVFDKEVNFDDLVLEELKPFEFEQIYDLAGKEQFTKKRVTIGVYTRRNKMNFKVIGKVNPDIVYKGPLPYEPLYNLKITWPLCGDSNEYLGREAYIHLMRKSLI